MFIERLTETIPATGAIATRFLEAGQINEIRKPFCYERPSGPRPYVMRSVERRRRRSNRLLAR